MTARGSPLNHLQELTVKVRPSEVLAAQVGLALILLLVALRLLIEGAERLPQFTP